MCQQCFCKSLFNWKYLIIKCLTLVGSTHLIKILVKINKFDNTRWQLTFIGITERSSNYLDITYKLNIKVVSFTKKKHSEIQEFYRINANVIQHNLR